jgi:hypothetical protein
MHAKIGDWLSQRRGRPYSSSTHRATCDLLGEWINPKSSLGADIAAIWVEVDIGENIKPSAPFPFLTLTPPWMRSGPRPLDRTAALVDEGLRVLTHGTLDPRVKDMVHTCLHAMPAQASLFHLAMRPMPEGDVVRLIAGTPWELVPEFLQRLDWPESIERVWNFLRRYCRDHLINSIQLDIGPSLGPRFGIEFFWPTSPRDAQWSRLFDTLVADDACSVERRELVSQWPGYNRTATGEITRGLLIKVVYEVGRPLRAKAYLPYESRLHESQADRANAQNVTPAGA